VAEDFPVEGYTHLLVYFGEVGNILPWKI